MQSEYGTPHEEVLNLPICTLRQKAAVIEARMKHERLREQSIAEWQTKTLAQFIAATVPSEKGKGNPLAKEAEKIRLRMADDTDVALDDAPPEVFIEQGSQVAQNSAGSYEALVAGFGGTR